VLLRPVGPQHFPLLGVVASLVCRSDHHLAGVGAP
jgi:hypothetical protein